MDVSIVSNASSFSKGNLFAILFLGYIVENEAIFIPIYFTEYFVSVSENVFPPPEI